MDLKKKNQLQLDLVQKQKQEIAAITKDTNLGILKAVEDKVFAQSLSVLEKVMDFAKLGFTPEGEEIIPKEWEIMPEEEKLMRLRLAKANWMPSGEVPHGVKMSYEIVMGFIKARAVENSGNKVLNIGSVSFPAPAPLNNIIEVMDIDE